MSWNLWGDERWTEREPSVHRMLVGHPPDVLAVQELSEKSAAFLDEALPHHRRVVDGLPGSPPVNTWSRLTDVDRGTIDLDEGGGRVAVWTRLRVEGTERPMVVVTTHLTWDDHPDPARGASVRDAQATRLRNALDDIVEGGEALVLLGDLNDERPSIPAFEAAGLVDCYQGLGREPEPTRPVPEYEPFETLPRAVDRILTNDSVQVMDASVPRFEAGATPPSDHWPVVATITLR